MLPEIVFWISLGAILYTYVLYPALIAVMVLLFSRKRPHPDGELPFVSIIVSLYNEERVLPLKLKNLSELDYPADRIEFLFGSDGSTDGTNRILEESTLPGLTLRAFPVRRGKVAVVNDLVPAAKGSVVVFSDANTLYQRGTVRRLVERISEPGVGGVCGELVLRSAAGNAAGRGEMSYWSYETLLKRWESECGTILGATGGVYAIRRDLFAPLPVDRPVVDDFLTPLQVVRRGYRMVYEPAAIAYEDASDSIGREFRRRVRIGAQDFGSIRYFADLLNPARGFVAFALWSHKILRWCVPFLALAVLVTTVMLAGESGFYRWALISELAVLAAAALGWLTERLRLRVGILGVPYYFVAMNLALFVGFLTFLTGRQKATWEVYR